MRSPVMCVYFVRTTCAMISSRPTFSCKNSVRFYDSNVYLTWLKLIWYLNISRCKGTRGWKRHIASCTARLAIPCSCHRSVQFRVSFSPSADRRSIYWTHARTQASTHLAHRGGFVASSPTTDPHQKRKEDEAPKESAWALYPDCEDACQPRQHWFPSRLSLSLSLSLFLIQPVAWPSLERHQDCWRAVGRQLWRASTMPNPIEVAGVWKMSATGLKGTFLLLRNGRMTNTGYLFNRTEFWWRRGGQPLHHHLFDQLGWSIANDIIAQDWSWKARIDANLALYASLVFIYTTIYSVPVDPMHVVESVGRPWLWFAPAPMRMQDTASTVRTWSGDENNLQPPDPIALCLSVVFILSAWSEREL